MNARPSPEQTLKSLDRVSKGEVWNATPPADHWTHVYDAASRAFAPAKDAAE